MMNKQLELKLEDLFVYLSPRIFLVMPLILLLEARSLLHVTDVCRLCQDMLQDIILSQDKLRHLCIRKDTNNLKLDTFAIYVQSKLTCSLHMSGSEKMVIISENNISTRNCVHFHVC